MNARQFSLTPEERALLAPLDARQWRALGDAARLYEDVLALLDPPMHGEHDIAAAREYLGALVTGWWTTEAACALLRWKAGLPLPVCRAFLVAELVGLGWGDVV